MAGRRTIPLVSSSWPLYHVFHSIVCGTRPQSCCANVTFPQIGCPHLRRYSFVFCGWTVLVAPAKSSSHGELLRRLCRIPRHRLSRVIKSKLHYMQQHSASSQRRLAIRYLFSYNGSFCHVSPPNARLPIPLRNRRRHVDHAIPPPYLSLVHIRLLLAADLQQCDLLQSNLDKNVPV